jgi:predicted component of type VI protein secretion system
MGLLNKFRAKAYPSIEAEILENITDLLNTKKTFGSYDPSLGLDSYFYPHSSGRMLQQIMQDIKNCLEKHEKRIDVIDIFSIPSQSRFLLSFMIKCKIKTLSLSLHLSFHHQKNLFNVELKS